MKFQKYVGLDVHKDKTIVAIAEGDRAGEVRAYGEISSDLVTTEKALRKIKGEHGVLHVAYEAGPTGFVLYRRLSFGSDQERISAATTRRPSAVRTLYVRHAAWKSITSTPMRAAVKSAVSRG